MANTLFLRLEAPLQAWGDKGQWSIRDTALEPTKSGLVGLLACALGLKEDNDLRQLSRAITIAVRCDRPGVTLDDFHTIVGGVVNAQGKIKADTVISKRAYLSDASFLVAIHSDKKTIAKFALALSQPVWPYYLGRKSCPPSRPVLEGCGDFPDLKTALEMWPIRVQKEDPDLCVRLVSETKPGNGTLRHDETSINSRRVYFPRYTQDQTIHPQNQVKEDECT
jgi:CRISPR system Cascade subunit CasD